MVTDGDLVGWEVSGQAGISIYFFCSIDDDCEIENFVFRVRIRFFTVAVVVVVVVEVAVVVAGRRTELGADAGRICKRQF